MKSKQMMLSIGLSLLLVGGVIIIEVLTSSDSPIEAVVADIAEDFESSDFEQLNIKQSDAEFLVIDQAQLTADSAIQSSSSASGSINNDPIVIIASSPYASSSNISSGFGGSSDISSDGGSGSSSAVIADAEIDDFDPIQEPDIDVSGIGVIYRPFSKELLDELKKFEPLPKVHYTWGMPTRFLDDPDDDFLYEFVRLTHSFAIGTSPYHNKSVLSSRVDNGVYTCARINKTNPDIPSSIAITYSPWHWEFLDRVPITQRHRYTIFSSSYSSYQSYKDEIEVFVQQMTFLKKQVADSNKKYGVDVKISAILLDCERFSPRKKDVRWNRGMAGALDDIHLEAAKLFPGARIEWYMRGMGGYSPAGLSKWYSYFTCLEKYIPSLSYSHYVVPDPEFMQEVFRKTSELADSLEVSDVVPWLGLAWGRKIIPGKVFHGAWDYDPKYSYQAGQELNDLCQEDRPQDYPQYNRAKVVILYTPFDKAIPAFGTHFVEYCKGAAVANKK